MILILLYKDEITRSEQISLNIAHKSINRMGYACVSVEEQISTEISTNAPAGQIAQPVGEVLEYPSPYGQILLIGVDVGVHPPLASSNKKWRRSCDFRLKRME